MSGDYERRLTQAGFSLIAGADEAGRGACAGPLVAAAVIWSGIAAPGIADSKQLTPTGREKAFKFIREHALAWTWVAIAPAECDSMGMQAANLTALRRALLRLDLAPDYGLTDGFEVDGLPFPSLGVWKGDQVATCVSAASIVAKVTRDRIMAELHQQYPQYGFDKHMGYCTQAHQTALEVYGPCPVHRLSFDNVPAPR